MEIRTSGKHILTLILFLLPGLLAATLLYYFQCRFTTFQIEEFIHSFGCSAALIFILLFTIRTFFVFAPYYVMLIIGGNLFGKTYGLLFNFLAVLLSATLAFILSRLIRFTIRNRFHFEKHQEYIDLIEKHGFKILIFMRLSIIFPFDILNYAAGLTGMKYRKFILANILGVIPEVVFLTVFGQSLQAPGSVQFMALFLILCLVLFFCFRYKKNITRWIKSFR